MSKNLSRSSFALSKANFSSAAAGKKQPKKIAITGGAGQIGYALVFRIASGALLGPDQPVSLHLIELPQALGALRGVQMELDDCAFPLLKNTVITDSLEKGFEDIDFAFLVGAKPRGPGMERGDLLRDNGKIFVSTGQALNKAAKKSARVLVVGNPANTNCLIASSHAPNISPENFSAMTRLDHNRALSAVATKAGVDVTSVERMAIWGNHSATQYPDVTNVTVGGRAFNDVIKDRKWVENTFIPEVQQRGAAIIKARGSSSAASAANAAIDHMRDWALGAKGWNSMALPSDGSYGVESGIYFSIPVVNKPNFVVERVKNLVIDEFSQQRFNITKKELLEERDMVRELFPKA